MRGECPNPQPDCKWAERGGCFSDTDHIVPRRLATTALTSTYIELQVNKQQLCRREHEDKTAAGDEPLPDPETMRQAIVIAQALGEVALGKRKMRRVYGAEWKQYYNESRRIIRDERKAESDQADRSHRNGTADTKQTLHDQAA